MIEQGRTRILG